MNNSDFTSHAFHADDTYPISLSIDPPFDGLAELEVEITAHPSINENDTYDFELVLHIMDVTVLVGSSLYCYADGDRAISSNTLNIGIISSLCKHFARKNYLNWFGFTMCFFKNSLISSPRQP